MHRYWNIQYDYITVASKGLVWTTSIAGTLVALGNGYRTNPYYKESIHMSILAVTYKYWAKFGNNNQNRLENVINHTEIYLNRYFPIMIVLCDILVHGLPLFIILGLDTRLDKTLDIDKTLDTDTTLDIDTKLDTSPDTTYRYSYMFGLAFGLLYQFTQCRRHVSPVVLYGLDTMDVSIYHISIIIFTLIAYGSYVMMDPIKQLEPIIWIFGCSRIVAAFIWVFLWYFFIFSFGNRFC